MTHEFTPGISDGLQQVKQASSFVQQQLITEQTTESDGPAILFDILMYRVCH